MAGGRLDNTFSRFGSSGGGGGGTQQPLIGRVLSIDLENERSPGIITFEIVSNGLYFTSKAVPVTSNIKHYPTLGELVELFPAPSHLQNASAQLTEFYYRAPVSIWQSNATNELPNAEQINQVTQSLKDDITYGLKSFYGDILFEGRTGNSLRFSSTADSKQANTWSKTGKRGDPITILTNGHQTTKPDPWNLITENPDIDLASIWMTSTQAIHIKDIDSFPKESFFAKRSLKKEDVTEASEGEFTTDSDIRSPAEQDGAPPLAQFAGYKEDNNVISKRLYPENQFQYGLSAIYSYHVVGPSVPFSSPIQRIRSGSVRQALRAKDPTNYDTFRLNFGSCNRNGRDLNGNPCPDIGAYIESYPFTKFLTPAEVLAAIGDQREYSLFLEAVQSLIMSVDAYSRTSNNFRRGLSGTIEGNIAYTQQNYGKRWDTLQSVSGQGVGGARKGSEFWQWDPNNRQFVVQVEVQEETPTTIYDPGRKQNVEYTKSQVNRYLEYVGLDFKTIRWEPYRPIVQST